MILTSEGHNLQDSTSEMTTHIQIQRDKLEEETSTTTRQGSSLLINSMKYQEELLKETITTSTQGLMAFNKEDSPTTKAAISKATTIAEALRETILVTTDLLTQRMVLSQSREMGTTTMSHLAEATPATMEEEATASWTRRTDLTTFKLTMAISDSLHHCDFGFEPIYCNVTLTICTQTDNFNF
jgi:hypothetical protein